MSNNLVVFNFESNDVRTMTDEKGDHWFVLVDVLKAMGSTTTPPAARASIQENLGEGWGVDNRAILDSLGRMRDTTIINESAVTFLVSRSNTETGKRLNRWLHVEVLPSIRKTGSYSAPNAQQPVQVNAAGSDADRINALISYAGFLETSFGMHKQFAAIPVHTYVKQVIGIASNVIDGILPHFDDKVASLNPTMIGERIGKSAKQVNLLLEKAGLQFKNERGEWNLTDAGRKFGYSKVFSRNGHDGIHVSWYESVIDRIKE